MLPLNDPEVSNQRVVVLAPHTDDGEFGCGGTIVRLVDQGCEVTYVAFSSCEESIPDGLPRDTLRREVRAATRELGISSDNLIVHSFPVRRFPELRQDILDVMVKINTELSPSLVLLPSKNDTHQDHSVVAHEGFRAFKRSSMLGYELPWNTTEFETTGFVMLDESHLARKLAALKCYESQSHRSYATEEFIRSWAVTRGVQIGCQFAETFEVVRSIVSI
ncbi:MAG: PIG-L family deacetylase [Fuerstiella sp.]|nr:PIG-L family deacetylase [Fuerstiella sp.]